AIEPAKAIVSTDIRNTAIEKPNILVRPLISVITPIFFRFGRSERFTPDVYLEDGEKLSEYGLDARVVHMPGHSKGPVGIVTPEGDLIGGDLILKPEKSDKPQLNSIIDDLEVARLSVNKLKDLNIKTVYPGHSTSFDFDTLSIEN
ncbi:MAG: MBL fold metallo-hydrolase, partial [Promethearchaeota archaeon]